ncbi:MAG: xanthine dehydrogenase subunit D [Actinomycetota bacterium]
MTSVADRTATDTRGRVGDDTLRPDGVPKVKGEFAFSSDLWDRGMLWGRTLRSPHAAARIVSIDIGPALAMPGVHAVLTADDVPGSATYGLEHSDQPVFASDVVRYVGEAIAVVAADHPETARLAMEAIVVEYEVVTPLTDSEAAITAEPIHPDGNVFRHLVIRHGDPDAVDGDVVVDGEYEIGMQDQAFMGPESAMALPMEDGGIELFIATQWLHVDQSQVAACLGMPEDKVRLVLAGVGGAFGAREDLSLQVHICLLALHTGRPVKMVFSREESFYGHVHRHPCRLRYRHHADREGNLVKIEASMVFDGGAYASSSPAVLANGVSFAAGPYRVPNAVVEGWAVRTNNPPCGAMRGFGVVQACFGHESQMDKLAAALDMDPVELRLRNAMRRGDRMITGQEITGTAPAEECLRAAAEAPLPPVPHEDDDDVMLLPGGAGRTADRGQIRRGVGYGLSIKNIAFSEGFDDSAAAACTLRDGVAIIKSACAEVGQGFVTIAGQIAREVLGVEEVVLDTVDTDIGSAGSTSASRQTWMSGGAVEHACRGVREQLIDRVARRTGVDPATLDLVDGRVVSGDGSIDVSVAEAADGEELYHELVFRHAPTQPLDENGQGDAHVSYAFAAHRAVVDVDPELGLVRVVEMATGQDIGRALNPVQVVGQIEGGIAQGVGLAVMEEIIVEDGLVKNASFTDYLIPTALDMPEVVTTLIEDPEPGAPFGAKGVGEPPTISSTPAVVAAIRAATGLELPRVPVRPADIALADS